MSKVAAEAAPKPPHLAAKWAAQFGDRAVVASYGTRPPYPRRVFTILASLLPPDRKRVLELGCGTGDLTYGLAGHTDTIDAIDPSVAMLHAAKHRKGAMASNIRWILDSAESFQSDATYGLVVAAESLHWMDWEHVFPKIARWLGAEGVLAIVTERRLGNLPWSSDLYELLARYSTNRDYQPYDLLEELSRRGLFREFGWSRVEEASFRQDAATYVESFHSRNGFSRDRMDPAAASRFDRAVRGLVAPHCPTGMITATITATVVWGKP